MAKNDNANKKNFMLSEEKLLGRFFVNFIAILRRRMTLHCKMFSQIISKSGEVGRVGIKLYIAGFLTFSY